MLNLYLYISTTPKTLINTHYVIYCITTNHAIMGNVLNVFPVQLVHDDILAFYQVP